MSTITKKYTNGEVTVIWQPTMCEHSAECFRGLPGVFNPRIRPWVNPLGSSTQEIIDQVNKCPSGALSFVMNDSETSADIAGAHEDTEEMYQPVSAEVIRGGPLRVTGTITLTHKDGRVETRQNRTSFCRCGQSKNKPFCDASHKTIEFDA